MQKEFAAFIGIDWADRKHDVCISVPGSAKLERLVLEHRPAAIRAWAEKLREIGRASCRERVYACV